jgi:FkbM family methyltransferase
MKYAAALNRCAQRRVVVDIGAHVGLWSYWMERDFETLHAFEPKSAHGECWWLNVPQRAGVELHPVALGASVRRVGLQTETVTSSGNTWVRLDGSDVEMRTLDSFGLTDVDLIKIDCQGYEYDVLLGACDTIQRCRPVLVVEQKVGGGARFGRGDQDAVTLLREMGAEELWNLGWDFVMQFPEAA